MEVKLDTTRANTNVKRIKGIIKARSNSRKFRLILLGYVGVSQFFENWLLSNLAETNDPVAMVEVMGMWDGLKPRLTMDDVLPTQAPDSGDEVDEEKE